MCERSWVRVPVGPCAFFLPSDIWWPVWGHAWAASSKGIVSSVPAWFRADSGTNLIKQGEIVAGARGPGFESRSGHVLFSESN